MILTIFQRTPVILFGLFGLGSAIFLLIFLGTVNNSMVVQEIRQLVKNPEFKDPYGLDLEDILQTIKWLSAFGLIILLFSIFGILGMFFRDDLIFLAVVHAKLPVDQFEEVSKIIFEQIISCTNILWLFIFYFCY